jgi:hypothetical protein
MIRALLAALIIVCPAASGQQPADTLIQCSHDGWCRVHVDLLKALVAQASLNCGSSK